MYIQQKKKKKKKKKSSAAKIKLFLYFKKVFVYNNAYDYFNKNDITYSYI